MMGHRRFSRLEAISKQRKSELIKRLKYRKLLKKGKISKNIIINPESLSETRFPLGISLGDQGVDDASSIPADTGGIQEPGGSTPKGGYQKLSNKSTSLRSKRKLDTFFKEKLEFRAKKAAADESEENDRREALEKNEKKKNYYSSRGARRRFLSARTPKGQPLMKNLIKDSLDKILASEKKSDTTDRV